jgi:oxaloacetate decarboxylase alpha subunit
VTPTSQIVGTQAVLNVLMGERYKMVPKESKALVKGEYGKTPAPIPEEITKKILGEEKPITCRPADLIEPELESIKAKIKDLMVQDEDVLSYALLPQVAETFFKNRRDGIIPEDSKPLPPKAATPAPAPKQEQNGNGVSDQVVAAISAAVTALGEENDTQFTIRSIRQTGISPWTLAGRIRMS